MFKRGARQTDLPEVAFHLNEFMECMDARLEPFDPGGTRTFDDPLAVTFAPFPDYLRLWAREDGGVWTYWKGFTIDEDTFTGLHDVVVTPGVALPAPGARAVLRAGEKATVVASCLFAYGLMSMCDAVVADPAADPRNLAYAEHLLRDDVRKRMGR